MSTVTRPRSEAEVTKIVASIKKVTKELTRNKKTAREFLTKNGYITKAGKLTRHYGG